MSCIRRGSVRTCTMVLCGPVSCGVLVFSVCRRVRRMGTRILFLCVFFSCGGCILLLALLLRTLCMRPILRVRVRVPLLLRVLQSLFRRLRSQPGAQKSSLRPLRAAALHLTDQDDARSRAMAAVSMAVEGVGGGERGGADGGGRGPTGGPTVILVPRRFPRD